MTIYWNKVGILAVMVGVVVTAGIVLYKTVGAVIGQIIWGDR